MSNATFKNIRQSATNVCVSIMVKEISCFQTLPSYFEKWLYFPHTDGSQMDTILNRKSSENLKNANEETFEFNVFLLQIINYISNDSFYIISISATF